MKTLTLLAKPIAQWPQYINSEKRDLQEIEGELSTLIQRAALLESYIMHRYNTGCGDQGHAASAKHAGAVLVKVRRALGFSYPANTPLAGAL